MMRTGIRAALATTVAATVGLSACQNKEPASDVTATAPPVMTVRPENIAVVTTQELKSGPSISGSLEPEQQATIRAEVAGAIKRMLVKAGDRVKQGQLLAQLDDTGVRDAQLSAKSALRSAEASLENVRRDADRAARLATAGAVPERELESARLAVTNAEGMVADARARLASAEQRLGYTELRAPFTGIVSAQPADAGDVVTMGMPLFTIVNPRQLRLEASVPAEEVGRLRVGMVVEFTVSGFERPFTGKVVRINPVVDPSTRQVQIYVTVPNNEGSLISGLFAEGRVATVAKRALTIPVSAVDVGGVTPTVKRVHGGRVALAVVTVGVRDETVELLEITEGLVEGDTVLVGTTQAVTPGAAIRVIGEEAQR